MRRASRPASIAATPAYAAKAIGWGFDLVTLLNDVRLLAGAAKASVDQARKLIGEQVAARAAAEEHGLLTCRTSSLPESCTPRGSSA